jgi:hypothetical protein
MHGVTEHTATVASGTSKTTEYHSTQQLPTLGSAFFIVRYCNTNTDDKWATPSGSPISLPNRLLLLKYTTFLYYLYFALALF